MGDSVTVEVGRSVGATGEAAGDSAGASVVTPVGKSVELVGEKVGGSFNGATLRYVIAPDPPNVTLSFVAKTSPSETISNELSPPVV